MLVTSGSATGTARTVVDAQREKGLKVGLVKVRMFRPFPRERLAGALRGRKAIGVLDRSVAFGWDCGPMAVETLALSRKIGPVPILSFIDGLANMDITILNIEKMIQDIYPRFPGWTLPGGDLGGLGRRRGNGTKFNIPGTVDIMN